MFEILWHKKLSILSLRIIFFPDKLSESKFGLVLFIEIAVRVFLILFRLFVLSTVLCLLLFCVCVNYKKNEGVWYFYES